MASAPDTRSPTAESEQAATVRPLVDMSGVSPADQLAVAVSAAAATHQAVAAGSVAGMRVAAATGASSSNSFL